MSRQLYDFSVVSPVNQGNREVKETMVVARMAAVDAIEAEATQPWLRRTLCFESQPRACELYVGANLLFAEPLLHLTSKRAERWALIADDAVYGLVGSRLLEPLRSQAIAVEPFTFPSGEASKSRAMKEQLEDQLFEAGFGKNGGVISLGGGVAIDLGGFIAATFCRGLPHIAIPTTLLAMVDGSLGGKCGLNTRYGKNCIGAIWQPVAILADVHLLKSLPQRHLIGGAIEMIKHAWIGDARYFDELLEGADLMMKQRDERLLLEAIWKSLQIKADCVLEDEADQGRRAALNCGHTVGHAVEQASCYRVSHGEAVAIGLAAEAYLAVQLGILPLAEAKRLWALLLRYEVELWRQVDWEVEALLVPMKYDKKNRGGKIHFAFVEEVGRLYQPVPGSYSTPVDEQSVQCHLNQFFCRYRQTMSTPFEATSDG